MNLHGVSVEKDGAIILVDGKDLYMVTEAQRKRGDVKTTESLRQILAASIGKVLSVNVHYYVAPSSNEYVIVGELPKPDRMPEMGEGRSR